MEELSIIERLTIFGLTRQEATIYLTLVSEIELSGYEVAKITGISRSNVYSALSGLVEKGAAHVIEGATTKYVAVAVEEYCSNRIRRLQLEKEYLIAHIKENQETSDGYITVEGYRHIEDKVFYMLTHARERLYLSTASSYIEEWKDQIVSAMHKGIKVVIISDKDYSDLGVISYIANRALAKDSENQIRLITDSTYVLTGEYNKLSIDTCLYSGQKNFVTVFKEAMRNEIKLIELEKEKS